MKKEKKWRGDRPPDAVIAGRVAEAVVILSHRPGVHRCELHKLLCQRWNCHWRTVDRIVSRAREEMRKRYGRTREEMRNDSAAFYEAMMNDPKATPADKRQARRAYDELFGLDAPKQMQVTGPEGGPQEIVIHVSPDELP